MSLTRIAKGENDHCVSQWYVTGLYETLSLFLISIVAKIREIVLLTSKISGHSCPLQLRMSTQGNFQSTICTKPVPVAVDW
jgi:hypothetical protein